MKLGIICPINWLEGFAIQSAYHLVLPNVFEKSKEYRDFYIKQAQMGDFITLDNGAYELGYPMEPDELLEIAGKLKADEIVAPDVILNYKKTVELTEEFLEQVRDKFDGKIGAVAQGSTFGEIKECYLRFLQDSRIDTIMLPFDIRFEIPNARKSDSFTKQRAFNRVALVNHILPLAPPKPIHLLGLSDGVELTFQKDHAEIRSNDSSSAFVHGKEGFRYTEEGLPCEKSKEKLDFFNKSLNVKQRDNIQFNIDMMKGFIKEVQDE